MLTSWRLTTSPLPCMKCHSIQLASTLFCSLSIQRLKRMDMKNDASCFCCFHFGIHRKLIKFNDQASFCERCARFPGHQRKNSSKLLDGKLLLLSLLSLRSCVMMAFCMSLTLQCEIRKGSFNAIDWKLIDTINVIRPGDVQVGLRFDCPKFHFVDTEKSQTQ